MISLSAEEQAIVQAILSGAPCPVGVFGSRVNGSARPASDLDLVFLTGAPLPIEVLAEYREVFAQSDLPFRVDCIDYSRCSESFKNLIDEEV